MALIDGEKKAIYATEGPCVVVASQEKGRAFLVARVSHLLEKGIASEGILVLFSSVLAAKATEKDIRETTSERKTFPRVTTFHSLSEELTGKHASLLGIKEDVRTLPPDETVKYAQRLLGTDPFLRDQYGKQARYVLAGDFNTLNASERAIVDLMGAAWRNICVIGEPERRRTLFDARADCFDVFKAQYINATEIHL